MASVVSFTAMDLIFRLLPNAAWPPRPSVSLTVASVMASA